MVEDHQPLIGDAVVNGRTGLLLVVEKVPGANTLEVTHGVEEALDDLRPGLSGVQVDSSVFRPADYINEAIDNLTLAVILGCLLLALALFAFLFEWRTALICFAAFAVSHHRGGARPLRDRVDASTRSCSRASRWPSVSSSTTPSSPSRTPPAPEPSGASGSGGPSGASCRRLRPRC